MLGGRARKALRPLPIASCWRTSGGFIATPMVAIAIRAFMPNSRPRNTMQAVAGSSGKCAAISAGLRRCRTTDSGHGFPIAPNLLDRNFSAAMRNQVWLADITYVWTGEGWRTWPPSWICALAVSWVGRWTSICAPNCRSPHYEWPSRDKGPEPG
nr:insertion element IS600 hypothetical 31 kDa protein [Bradyrhizobium sp. DOA9]